MAKLGPEGRNLRELQIITQYKDICSMATEEATSGNSEHLNIEHSRVDQMTTWVNMFLSLCFIYLAMIIRLSVTIDLFLLNKINFYYMCSIFS